MSNSPPRSLPKTIRLYLEKCLPRYAAIPDLAPWLDISRETSQAELMLKLLQEHPTRIFDRNFFAPGHFTGSALLVDPTGLATVLTLHRKLNLWLQLGGHADGHQDLAQVALQEAREESGLSGVSLGLLGDGQPLPLDIDVHQIPAYADEPAHWHFDLRFLVWAKERRPVSPTAESKELAWFDLDKPLPRDEPSLARLVAKWLYAWRPEEINKRPKLFNPHLQLGASHD